ncbi:Hsp20 family protein [Candidatus Dojkabacteria bacterium]|nr:Hsp20 family protein [Candidatus Dojkabacteria bacterium]
MRSIRVWNPWKMVPRDFFDLDSDDLAEWNEVEMDMYEEKDNIVVKLKIAGFPKDKIDISIENGRLTVKGNVEKESEEDNKDKKYYRKEIQVMSFTRSVDLPVSVISDKAKASFSDGMLEIVLPKSEEAKPKKISVEVD